jgi:hypothetical protein
MRRHRDPGINHIEARRGHCCYGMGLGIVILDDVYPGFPGDVRNASAYPFPIQYEIAEGLDIETLLHGADRSRCLEPLQRAAGKLAKMGCRAIAAECGFFACFQREIASCVEVPVFMSSLLQVPFAQQLVGPDRVVGVLISELGGLTDDQVERELIPIAVDFYRAHPNMGAMVLECTGYPPFARAIQREIDIPIFSWGTLLDYAYSVSVHRDYYGHV